MTTMCKNKGNRKKRKDGKWSQWASALMRVVRPSRAAGSGRSRATPGPGPEEPPAGSPGEGTCLLGAPPCSHGDPCMIRIDSGIWRDD